MSLTYPQDRSTSEPEDALQTRLSKAVRLQRKGRLDEAVRVYEAVLENEPECGAAWSNLGVALRSRGQQAVAVACYRRALEIDPYAPGVLGNLGNVLKDLGRFEEAIIVLRGSVAAEPSNSHTHRNLGLALKEAGELDEALAELDVACRLAPGAAEPEFERALTLLQLGRFEEGWRGYESRWRLPEVRPPSIEAQRWRGESFEGKTLLVTPEQGFGDAIFASRFLPGVKRRGGTVVLECKPELRRLFAGLHGVDRWALTGEPLEQGSPIDLYCPMMSLPGLFAATPETSPELPVLHPAPDAQERLRPLLERAGNRFRVAVVWSGSLTFKANQRRAAALEPFVGLADQPGVQLYSLQKGALEGALRDSGARAAIIDVGGIVSDFADTAAFLREVDLVIMTDSAVAHLAGSMDRPVWNLLTGVPYWLYGTEGDRTPWYPSMHLFRSARLGCWDDVFRQVRAGLAGAVRARAEGCWPARGAAAGRSSMHDVSHPVSAGRGTATPSALTLVRSAFPRADGKPRFTLSLLLADPNDPGLRALANEEREYGGYEYPTRAFLDEHLEPGDVFIDVGAHWGVFSLHAASRHPGDVSVLAIEAHPANAAQLVHAVQLNGFDQQIEVVAAAAGAKPGVAPLALDSTMGHSLYGYGLLGGGRRGSVTVPVLSIDDLLAARPHLAGRRTIVKVDVEGYEPEVLEGATGLLASGRVVAVVWECGRAFLEGERRERMLAMVADLTARGFESLRFPHPRMGGQLVPFAPTFEAFNVFSLAADLGGGRVHTRVTDRPEALPAPARSPEAADLRAATTELLLEWRATDGARWASWRELQEGADERAERAACFITPGARVLDLGAGAMALRRFLPDGCWYVPADLVRWETGTRVVDLNQGMFPSGEYDVVVALDVLGFLHDPASTLQRARQAASHLVLSYRVSDDDPVRVRRELGYFNDFTADGLSRLLRETGWSPEAREVDGVVVMFSCRRV